MRTFLLQALLLVGLFAQTSIAQRTQVGVATAVEQLRLALIDPSEARLSALVADSLSYGHSSGKVENKAEFIHALVSGEATYRSINLSGQTITLTDNVAVVRHIHQGEIASKGVPSTVNLSVLLVWVYQRNGWKLLARQAVKR